jgi:hypothetical protein
VNFDFNDLMEGLTIGEPPGESPPVAVREPAQEASSHKPAKQSRRTTAKTRGGGPLYLDIETIPDFSRMEGYGLDPLPVAAAETPTENLMSVAEFLSQDLKAIKESAAQINPPLHWIDEVEQVDSQSPKPRKGVADVCKEMRKAKEAVAVAHAERIKLMSVTPEFCRIVAIAWAMGDGEVVCHSSMGDNHSERMALMEWWSVLAKYTGPIVTFNGLKFDLPAIFVRSSCLFVEPTRRIDLKPWGGDVIDLYAIRFPPGTKPMGQKRLCAALKIDDPSDQEDDGSLVYQQFVAGEHAKIAEHVQKDIVRLRRLHEFYRGFFCN